MTAVWKKIPLPAGHREASGNPARQFPPIFRKYRGKSGKKLPQILNARKNTPQYKYNQLKYIDL